MDSIRVRIGDEELDKYRALDCGEAPRLLTEHVKCDPTFVPIKSGHTHRWHVVAGERHFELLTTGPKWFDLRAERGGGGAIDLAMHLFGIDFKGAVWRLRQVVI